MKKKHRKLDGENARRRGRIRIGKGEELTRADLIGRDGPERKKNKITRKS
jgi:hypothetical protein